MPPGAAISDLGTGVYSRFRYSTDPGLSFDDLAMDGEVEDYLFST